jgi:hypothetical protein
MKLSEAITKYGDVDLWKCIALNETDHQDRQKADLKEKIQTKKIDMTACIESGIDCEFALKGADFIYLGMLDNICTKTVHKYQETSTEVCYNQCRPRMNGHIHANPWKYNKQPIPDGFKLEVYILTEKGRILVVTTTSHATKWKDVIMFEVIGIAEGYTL